MAIGASDDEIARQVHTHLFTGMARHVSLVRKVVTLAKHLISVGVPSFIVNACRLTPASVPAGNLDLRSCYRALESTPRRLLQLLIWDINSRCTKTQALDSRP